MVGIRWDAAVSTGPFTEVDQLTALAAKGLVGVLSDPGHRFLTGRTFDDCVSHRLRVPGRFYAMRRP